MKAVFRWICAWLVVSVPALALGAAPAAPGVDRLPADTWVLVNWHGVSAADRVRGTNPVMRLWNDAQFRTLREQLFEELARENSSFSRAKADDVLAVLENPLVLGVAGDPLAPGVAASTLGVFGVLNKKGKEAAWTRLREGSKPKAGAVESTYSFAGVQVKKTVTTTQPAAAPEGAPPAAAKVRETFEATLGDYELFASQQKLIEALISRLQPRNAPAGASLASDATYQRALRFRSTGPLMEAFVKIPDLSRLPVPAQPQMNMGAALKELHPERMHGLWLSAGMGADRMVLRAALLGDTTPGSLLDLIGGNVTEFQTLAAAPADAAFSTLRLDLQALYATLMRAVKAALPPDQASAATMLVDSLVIGQTGMRATELLSLFSGELGASDAGEGQLAGALPGMVLVPLTRGEPVLGLLRMMAGGLSADEEEIAGATVLRFNLPEAVAAAAADAPGGPVLVAVAPNLLVVTQDRAALQAALARAASGSRTPAGSLAADAGFQAMRKALPAELNGISYTDVARGHMDGQMEMLRKTFAKQKQDALDAAAAAAKGDGQAAANAEKAAELNARAESYGKLEEAVGVIGPLLRKYLKVSAGGSWKAADGIFYDSWVN